MKLKKGSPEAKRFMAKIRAKKKPVKKISGIKESNKLKKDLKAKKLRLTHGYTTVKRKLSGVIKNRSLGASGDYAKFEIAVIKNLAKLLKKTYKKVQEIVNTDESLLNIISKNFDKKISVSITAKELKAKLIIVAKKNPLESFIEILNKLPKKDQVSKGVKFPIKLPATVQIGSNKKIKSIYMSGLNKKYLQVQPSGHGHYKVTTEYYNKTISCITNNMQAIDNYKSEDGSRRITKGYNSLRNECIRKNKKY